MFKAPNVRLGPIQRKLVQWVKEGNRVMVGASTVPPAHLGLGGYSLDEVEPALDRLVARRILIRENHCFYALRAQEPEEGVLGTSSEDSARA